jgi:hypothetical protein
MSCHVLAHAIFFLKLIRLSFEVLDAFLSCRKCGVSKIFYLIYVYIFYMQKNCKTTLAWQFFYGIKFDIHLVELNL